MKRILCLFTFTLVGFFLTGCNNANTPTPSPSSAQTNANNATSSAATAKPNGNQNQPTNSNSAPAQVGLPAGPDAVPQALLRGTYAISEVQHDGLVEMVSPDNTTEITFVPPASFTRQSKKGGKVDHTDSGEYDVFGNNTMILKIMMSRKKIQVTPVVKRHQFSLSADGTEFRLTSENGKTAVFRRIKDLPSAK